MAGDRAGAGRLLETSQVIAAGLDDFPATIAVLQARALMGLFEDDFAAVRSASSEGVRRSREVGDWYALEMMLLNLGLAALNGGDRGEARPLFTEALRIARRIDDRVAQYLLLDALGCHAAGSGQGSGQPRLAAQLLGAAETVQAGIGTTLFPYIAGLVVRATESTRAALGTSAFQAEFEAGKRLSRGAAIALALGEPAHVAASGPGDTGTSPLGKREAQVAHLVAEGLGNKQIAARLLISEHTVDSHIRSILNKLGFNSRAQIAAWMAANQ